MMQARGKSPVQTEFFCPISNNKILPKLNFAIVM